MRAREHERIERSAQRCDRLCDGGPSDGAVNQPRFHERDERGRADLLHDGARTARSNRITVRARGGRHNRRDDADATWPARDDVIGGSGDEIENRNASDRPATFRCDRARRIATHDDRIDVRRLEHRNVRHGEPREIGVVTSAVRHVRLIRKIHDVFIGHERTNVAQYREAAETRIEDAENY